MVRASLRLTIPKRLWIGDLSRRFPDAAFLVRSVRSSDGIGIGFVEIVAADVSAVLSRMRTYDALLAVEEFQTTDERALVQIEAEDPVPLRILDRSGVPIETPFEISDGCVRWDLTTTRTRLSDLAEELEQSDLGYMVEHVWDSAQFEHVLTDRQQEVVETALERGYYDSPRACTQAELADHLDLAKSTCSELLHRAEERIVKQFTDGKQPAFTTLPGST